MNFVPILLWKSNSAPLWTSKYLHVTQLLKWGMWTKPKLLMATAAVWCYRFVLLFGFVLFYLLVANIVICTIPQKVDTRIINHNYIVLWCSKCINNNTDASIERLMKFTFFTVLIKVDFQAFTVFVWLLERLCVKRSVTAHKTELRCFCGLWKWFVLFGMDFIMQNLYCKTMHVNIRIKIWDWWELHLLLTLVAGSASTKSTESTSEGRYKSCSHILFF